MMEYLLEQGADVLMKDYLGHFPLYVLLNEPYYFKDRWIEAALMLIGYGATFEVQTKDELEIYSVGGHELYGRTTVERMKLLEKSLLEMRMQRVKSARK